eukprot:jgi/Bigna1/127095/aug1.3_g1803
MPLHLRRGNPLGVVLEDDDDFPDFASEEVQPSSPTHSRKERRRAKSTSQITSSTAVGAGENDHKKAHSASPSRRRSERRNRRSRRSPGSSISSYKNNFVLMAPAGSQSSPLETNLIDMLTATSSSRGGTADVVNRDGLGHACPQPVVRPNNDVRAPPVTMISTELKALAGGGEEEARKASSSSGLYTPRPPKGLPPSHLIPVTRRGRSESRGGKRKPQLPPNPRPSSDNLTYHRKIRSSLTSSCGDGAILLDAKTKVELGKSIEFEDAIGKPITGKAATLLGLRH